jgi:hypothetical protein
VNATVLLAFRGVAVIIAGVCVPPLVRTVTAQTPMVCSGSKATSSSAPG